MIIKDYANWSEYRAALAEMDPDACHSNSVQWAGSATIGEALAIADRGWPEGMEFVRDITIPIINDMASQVSHEGMWEYDVTGANYDVGSYLSGVPECWLAPSAVASKPCITISANVVSSAGIAARHVSTRGAAVAALALALQSSGYAVRIYAIQGMAVETGSRIVWERVCLTNSNGGPLDVDRILFGLAHISNSRQLGYALGCHLKGEHLTTSLYWPNNDPKSKPPAEWASDIYLSPSHLNDVAWDDPKAVGAWVTETYAQLSGAK